MASIKRIHEVVDLVSAANYQLEQGPLFAKYTIKISVEGKLTNVWIFDHETKEYVAYDVSDFYSGVSKHVYDPELIAAEQRIRAIMEEENGEGSR